MDPKVFGPDIGIPRIVGEAKLRQLRDVDMPYAWASGPGFIAEKKVGAERVVTDAPEDNQPERPYFRTSGRVSVTAVPDGEPSEVQILPDDSPTNVEGRPGPNADEEQTGPLRVRATTALNRGFQNGRKSFGAYKQAFAFDAAWFADYVWPLPTKFQIRWGAYFGNHHDFVTQELMHPLDLNPSRNFGFAPLKGVAFYDTIQGVWWTATTFTQIVSVGFGRVGRSAPKVAFTVPVHAVSWVAHSSAQYPGSTTFVEKTFVEFQDLLVGAGPNEAVYNSSIMQPVVQARPAAATKTEGVIGGRKPGILVAHTARMFEFQLGYHTRPAVSYFVEDRGDGTPYLRTDTLNIFFDAVAYEVDRTWVPYAMETGGDGRTYVFAAYSAPRSAAGLTNFNQLTTNTERNAGIAMWHTRNRGSFWDRHICTEFRELAFPSSYGQLVTGVRPASGEPVTSPDLWDRSISESFEGSSFPRTVLTCAVEDGIIIAFTGLRPDPTTFASGLLRYARHPSAPVWADMSESNWATGIACTQVFKVSGNTITKLYEVDNSALAAPTSRMFLDMIYLGGDTLLAKVGATIRGNPPVRNYYQGNGVYGATIDRNVTSGLGDGNSFNNWMRPVNSGCTILRSEDGGATWAELSAEGFPGSSIMCPEVEVGFSPSPLLNRAVIYPATPRPIQMSGRFTCVVPRLPKKSDPDEFDHATVTVPGYDPSEGAYFAYVSKDSGETWERQGRISATNRFHHMASVGPNDIGRNFAKIEYIGTRRTPSPYNPALPTLLDPEPDEP